MKKLLPYVLAFHAALAAAILLWALQEKFPGPLTNTLSPIWNSPWEMGKAAFFPLLAAAPTLWVLQKGGSPGWTVPDGPVRRGAGPGAGLDAAGAGRRWPCWLSRRRWPCTPPCGGASPVTRCPGTC